HADEYSSFEGGGVIFKSFFEVVPLDGSARSQDVEVPTAVAQGSGKSMDFDGTRLTWMTTRCLRTWLLVENVDPPYPPKSAVPPCPFPRPVRGSARIDRDRTIHLTLACRPRT